jgi:hypothetical protein
LKPLTVEEVLVFPPNLRGPTTCAVSVTARKRCND